MARQWLKRKVVLTGEQHQAVDFRGVLRGNPDPFRASEAPLAQSSDPGRGHKPHSVKSPVHKGTVYRIAGVHPRYGDNFHNRGSPAIPQLS